MAIYINDEELRDLIEDLQTKYAEKFGANKYAFFGQLIVVGNGKLKLEFGSFTKESGEVEKLIKLIGTRSNLDYDDQALRESKEKIYG